MNDPDLQGARSYALDRLSRELPLELCYHTLRHTRDDVVPSAERLAAGSGIVGEDLLLLRTAAYFHDIGFIYQRIEHEAASAQIAAEALPQFGYSPEQIARIRGMIMATRLPQSPQNLCEQVLADSDLDLLGTEHFWTRSELLRREHENFGRAFSDGEWLRNQLLFVRSHRYWTPAAQRDRNAGKQRNALLLMQQIAELTARDLL